MARRAAMTARPAQLLAACLHAAGISVVPCPPPTTPLLPSTHRSMPRQPVLALNTQGITMSVKALYLCLKLTEKLRRANQTENSEGRAFARPFIESGRAEAEDRAGGHLLGHNGTTGRSASRRTISHLPRRPRRGQPSAIPPSAPSPCLRASRSTSSTPGPFNHSHPHRSHACESASASSHSLKYPGYYHVC